MKLIHLINKVATCITLVLYILVCPGMMAQIILGPLQVLLALVITIAYYNKLDSIRKGLLLRYWAAAGTALLLAFISYKYQSQLKEYGMIVFVFAIPMMVACYFVYVTSLLNKYIECLHTITQESQKN